MVHIPTNLMVIYLYSMLSFRGEITYTYIEYKPLNISTLVLNMEAVYRFW